MCDNYVYLFAALVECALLSFASLLSSSFAGFSRGESHCCSVNKSYVLVESQNSNWDHLDVSASFLYPPCHALHMALRFCNQSVQNQR